MQARVLVIAVVLTALVIGVIVWLGSRPEEVAPAPAPEPVATPPAATTEPETAVTTAPEPDVAPMPPLPSLEESDARVREELLAAAPTLEPWVEREDLIRRFSVVAENAGRGEYPRRQLDFLAPSGPYPVRHVGEQVFVDPAGYGRYEAFVATATAVDPETAATLLIEFSPLIGEALGELGIAGSDPREVIVAAIDQVLATPEIEGDIELTQTKVLYEYVDPDLEALPPLQKQLLRMGPDNVERVKAYLREVRQGLTGVP